jgi:hypothetical protein
MARRWWRRSFLDETSDYKENIDQCGIRALFSWWAHSRGRAGASIISAAKYDEQADKYIRGNIQQCSRSTHGRHHVARFTVSIPPVSFETETSTMHNSLKRYGPTLLLLRPVPTGHPSSPKSCYPPQYMCHFWLAGVPFDPNPRP